MARPLKQTVDYFPHDSHASEGDTLTILQNRFKNDGYAFWFKLLEKLASSDGHFINCNNPVKWQVLLAKLGVDEARGNEIMNILVETQAIDPELWKSKLIWCQHLVDNLADVYKNRRAKKPEKPVSTGNNPVSTTDNSVIPCRNATKETKGNKTKVKESKESDAHAREDYKVFGEMKNVLLSEDELRALRDELGEKEADRWIDELSLAKASKKIPSECDYATIRLWQKREEEKNPSQKRKPSLLRNGSIFRS